MRPINMRPFAQNRVTWLVWRPDQGGTEEDAYTVISIDDAKTVAEDFAEWIDSQGDYSIVGGSPEVLHVKREGGSDVEVFAVFGETVSQYTARKA